MRRATIRRTAERKIKVVLSNSSYKLFYRTRYLAPDEAHPSPMQPLAMDTNMRHGAPNSTELFFEAKVVPVGGKVAATTEEYLGLQKFAKFDVEDKRSKIKRGAAMVQHYEISFAVLGRQLEMPEVDGGRYATDLKFGLAAYSPDSEMMNGTEVTFKSSIPEVQPQKIVSDGYHASMSSLFP